MTPELWSKLWSAAVFKIHAKVFCLVELRGLEPLTPCLQTTGNLVGKSHYRTSRSQ